MLCRYRQYADTNSRVMQTEQISSEHLPCWIPIHLSRHQLSGQHCPAQSATPLTGGRVCVWCNWHIMSVSGARNWHYGRAELYLTYLSLCVTICHCIVIYVTIWHYLSLSVGICHYIVTICQYIFTIKFGPLTLVVVELGFDQYYDAGLAILDTFLHTPALAGLGLAIIFLVY